MAFQPFPHLTCPLDGAPLVRQGPSWRCPDGHCFDVAAQGYVNLLPVQLKRSRDPGDSKAMVAARRRFLNSGAYQPLADGVARALLADLPAGGLPTCLDGGCGEGYYLRRLAALAGERPLAVLGLDISKWAVQAAAKQAPGATWVVGSNARLPVPDAGVDRLLCLFGFPAYGEFARVLRPEGQLLMLDPGPDHLRELREVIYPRLKPEKPAAPLPPGFRLLGRETFTYALEVDGQPQIADLLAMTPHLHRATPEGRARAAALDHISLTVEVVLQRLGRGKTE